MMHKKKGFWKGLVPSPAPPRARRAVGRGGAGRGGCQEAELNGSSAVTQIQSYSLLTTET